MCDSSSSSGTDYTDSDWSNDDAERTYITYVPRDEPPSRREAKKFCVLAWQYNFASVNDLAVAITQNMASGYRVRWSNEWMIGGTLREPKFIVQYDSGDGWWDKYYSLEENGIEYTFNLLRWPLSAWCVSVATAEIATSSE